MKTVVVVALALMIAGCSSVPAFQDVDLDRDLGKGDIARYENEWKAQQAAGSGDEMAPLERTNGWPLGILAYWRRGAVMRTAGADGAPGYGVRSTLGIGPLSILYVSGAHATFDGTGRRVSTMKMQSLLYGHLAMIHQNDVLLADGTRQKSWSAGLLHHIINIHRMNGHTSVSLFSSPNLIGVESHDRRAGH
jgi:hypothetical protein